MTLTVLTNHRGYSLEAAAAASLARFEHDHGVIPVSSAYRSLAEQQHLIDRYFVIGGAANRPPNLYAPARPASASKHTSGLAVDTDPNGALRKYGAAYGWSFNFDYDKVHAEYNAAKDQHKPVVATGYLARAAARRALARRARARARLRRAAARRAAKRR